MSKHYQTAIDNLNRAGIDWRGVAQEWAKAHPASFNQAVLRVAGPAPPSVEKKIKEEARAYKIGAIRMARSEFGLSLKDAKEYVEQIQQEDADYER